MGRHVFKVALCAAIVGLCAIAGGPSMAAEEKVKLSVSLFTPPSSDLNKQMRKINEALDKETGGRLNLELYEASQMGPAPRQFDLARTGVSDIAVALLGLTPGRFPLMEMLDIAGVADSGTGLDIVAPVSAAALELSDRYLQRELNGVKLLNVTILPNPVLLTTREIMGLDEIKNKRIRYPGPAYAKMLESVHSVPTFIASTEMGEALSRGTIDGALTGYAGIVSFKLLDSARYLLELASGGMTFVVVMNPAAYEKLPDDLKSAFDKHFGAQGQREWGRVLARGELESRDELVQKGLVIKSLSPQDAEAFAQISKKLQSDAADALDAKGMNGTEFLKSLAEVSKRYH
ncbi:MULTISPECIES: TRAP transporter substrate-binding protein DctP [Alphaproteobacteria]|nr:MULTISPECIES: TRAP transporter substrate-binding protein DctP [Alphaproteobacteria]